MSGIVSTLIGWFGFIGMTVLVIYFLARRLKKSAEPGDLVVKWIITAAAVALWIFLGVKAGSANWGSAFLIVGAAAGSAIILAYLWGPHIADAFSSPITRWFDGGDEAPERRPLYSMAIAQRKRGAYDNALTEIRRQLAMFPQDYEGWMMLAEVQAIDMKDLQSALETIEYLLTLENLAPKNAAYALGRVADWHLDRSDRDAALAALQRIIELLPETVEAQLAAQRIAHLASAEHLADMHEPRVIALQHHEEHIGLRGETVAAPVEESASMVARRYLDHLESYPQDNEVREKLAMVYANDFKRLDLACAELEQLINTRNQLPKNVVHWLNLLADFQIRLGAGVDAARQTLQRIIAMDGKSAAATNANVRISQLRLELNQNTQQRTLKLGNYEQNIGLKRMTSSGTNEQP